MNIEKYAKIVFGLLLIVLGLYSYTFFWEELVAFIKGGVGLVLIFFGLLVIALGISD